MQERHLDRRLYFKEQAYTTQKYVIPFVELHHKLTPQSRILEIGCGEGGNLEPFLDLGCTCVGVELNEPRIKQAKEFYAAHTKLENLELIHSNIFDVDRPDFTFDVIILRDVIEHIHNQELFMHLAKKYLKPEGVFFIGMPPWCMPFGGHQQICVSKLSKIPFIHLLPAAIYRWLLKSGGESERTIDELLEIKETGISIERIKRICKKEQYQILEEQMYFINPNYEIKFKLKPRKVSACFARVPYLRNFYTTAAYFLLKQ